MEALEQFNHLFESFGNCADRFSLSTNRAVLTAKGTKLIKDPARTTEPYHRQMLAPLTETERGTLLAPPNWVAPLDGGG